MQSQGCRVQGSGFAHGEPGAPGVGCRDQGVGFRTLSLGLLHWVVCCFLPVPFGDEAVSVAADFAAEHFPDAMFQSVRFKCSGAGLGVPVAAQCSCGQGVE